MNEQLQQALAELLNKTVAGVDAGTAFLQAEMPEVIQQLLMWKLAISLVGVAICLAAITLYLLVLKAISKGIKAKEGIWYDYDSPFSGASIFSLAVAVAGFFLSIIAIDTFFERGSEALQIMIAPKIYLIEYAASLAK